jgi:hypothetical protein
MASLSQSHPLTVVLPIALETLPLRLTIALSLVLAVVLTLVLMIPTPTLVLKVMTLAQVEMTPEQTLA